MMKKTDKNEKQLMCWLFWMKVGARAGCHQKPERSFFFRGWQFPVCARCTGVTAGYLAGAALLPWVLLPVWADGLLCLPMLIDWLLQRTGVLPSVNLRRLLTGFAGGVGLMQALGAAAVFLFRLW